MLRTLLQQIFQKSFLRLFGVVILTLGHLTVASAQGFQYEEGTHFKRLERSIATANDGVIEVTQFFSYGCPVCYEFEPLIQQWRKSLSSDVEFRRTPAVWPQPGYELYATTFYTLQTLGFVDQLHGPLFDALHGERRTLSNLRQMTEFMSEHGVEPVQFVQTYSESYEVRRRVKQADARGRIYMSSAPALIVNGKYLIQSEMVGSNQAMLRVANFLIDRERRILATHNQL